MRIIAGRLKGRQFDAPSGYRTHPMSEKARGGLFNAMGDITGLTVLDVFAGSGALSFEAISRGAASATAIEIDKRAITTIVKGVASLGLQGRIKAIRANASGWSDNNSQVNFDMVFAAPPYDNLQAGLLQKLVRHVKPGGIYVLDWPGGIEAPSFDGLKLIKQKNYGDAQLVIYRRIS